MLLTTFSGNTISIDIWISTPAFVGSFGSTGSGVVAGLELLPYILPALSAIVAPVI